MTNQNTDNDTQIAPPKDMANAIRALTMDAVQAAKSGHPGMPMGMADVATVLYGQFLKFNPQDPNWPDRDRFVLSAGHGSMLMYSLLHLTGYDSISMEDIKNFRQLGSPCAGHPEFGEAAGIETTTGPLGQGIANAVGMAMAEKLQAARYGSDIVDHYTYAIAGDGCLMEGISHEAISMAGHLNLSKLILLFDDNGISIDGPTDLTVSDDQCARFAASGWHVQAIDGHDPEAIAAAIAAAKAADKPSMIACKTTIGFGSPNKQGTSATHGSPLGVDEIAATRDVLGWPYPAFEIPANVYAGWHQAGSRSASDYQAWQDRVDVMDAGARAEFEASIDGTLPASLADAISAYKQELIANPKKVATRSASQMALEVINGEVKNTIGGSADLTGSNNTNSSQQRPITADDFSGSFIHYGVREHGMAAAMNGIVLHGGFIPYSGTFLVFTDYCRPSIRLSALMEQRVIYVMTHDSIGLGEDGPTHQPVEHVASLRAMPNLNVYRPADVVETVECWQLSLETENTPSIHALTRQGLEQVRLENSEENLCGRGAYELRAADGDAAVTLFASGSEIGIAMAARDTLQAEGIGTRVVSVPCMELFHAQSADYREETIQPGTVRIAIEAGVQMGWERFIGDAGGFVGMDSFGASAPINDLYNHFGITAEHVVEEAKARL
jgi:transketolase